MIEYTDAWGMYRAQMAEYGVKVRFGGGLCRRGERVENYLHRKFYRQQEAPTVEDQAWEWAAKLWREEKERPPTVEEQAREWALKGALRGQVVKGSSFLDAIEDLAGRYQARSAHFPDSDTVSVITWDENQEYLVTGAEVRRKGIDAVLVDIADFLDAVGVPHKEPRA